MRDIDRTARQPAGFPGRLCTKRTASVAGLTSKRTVVDRKRLAYPQRYTVENMKMSQSYSYGIVSNVYG
jgi:hypothetical protein